MSDLLKSRYERGKENTSGKMKIPWKNPLEGSGGSKVTFAKVSVKKKGLHVGVTFKF
jgi:hypothetical protein